ncbi:MAG: DHHA1 domain-containing protein [Candidatus Brocadiia bacterium]
MGATERAVAGQARKARRGDKQLQQERKRAARSIAGGSLLDEAETCGDARMVVATMPGGHAELRSAADVLRRENEATACVLASAEAGSVALVVGLSEDLVERGLNAREIAQEAAEIVNGGGGGRDDLAQAGGSDVERVGEALERARQMLREALASDESA